MDQNGNSRSESSVPPPPPQHPEVASGGNSHPYSRKERSPSPRGYRRSSYSPRRRSPSPRSGYRNGRDDRYREDRYVRDDRYDRGYSRGGSGGYRDERGYPYGSERRGSPSSNLRTEETPRTLSTSTTEQTWKFIKRRSQLILMLDLLFKGTSVWVKRINTVETDMSPWKIMDALRTLMHVALHLSVYVDLAQIIEPVADLPAPTVDESIF
ncbi:6874_t:CDS:2 [Acaulospora colombiana]|uniref:6874_t:CDS:1 n=1 Tax=Acaulospora colombiana TaxID=27376 RepID=A0ACA9L2I0_9GLOM|nr:6874_t:CDS:2 [Acaulospora colombiana]